MMTKGKYWIGDLCYVLEKDWDEVCSLLFSKKNEMKSGEFELSNGVKFALYGTAWGDGMYQDQNGNSYGVDAGVIGCVKVEDLLRIGESTSSLGNIHDFKEDFTTGYDEGTIYFGDIRIDTDPSYEDEEDDSCPHCGLDAYSVACHCDE
mgnify:CR=1 FL=1